MSLESGEFMTIFLSVMTVLSLTANGVLIWYIRKLLTAQDEISIELSENIYAFQDELQTLLNTDVLAGEPYTKPTGRRSRCLTTKHQQSPREEEEERRVRGVTISRRFTKMQLLNIVQRLIGSEENNYIWNLFNQQ